MCWEQTLNRTEVSWGNFFLLYVKKNSWFQKKKFFMIKCFTISFKTNLLLYKIELPLPSWGAWLPFTHWHVTSENNKLFMMVQKVQTYNKNQYHKRSPLSTTGIPRLLVPQKVTLEHHRNPKIMFCILMSNATNIAFLDWYSYIY